MSCGPPRAYVDRNAPSPIRERETEEMDAGDGQFQWAPTVLVVQIRKAGVLTHA